MITARKSYEAPEPKLSEVYRYMGIKGAPDVETAGLAQRAVEKIKQNARCAACYARLPIERPDENTIVIGSITTNSVFLAKNLSGCSEAYIFIATIGSAADRLIAAAKPSPSMALALDAAASALTEALCDSLNRELKQEAEAEGKILRPRYSAGFGDFTLEYQKYFVNMLGTPKNLGVVLRSDTMLFPTKSVSALIGIAERR